MSIFTAPFRRTKRYQRWIERITAEAATEAPCKSKFRTDMLLPKGKAHSRKLFWFAVVSIGWVALAYVLPELEDGMRTFLAVALAVTAFRLGKATGWLEAAHETYAWTHGEEPKREDNPLDRDPELWMRTDEVGAERGGRG